MPAPDPTPGPDPLAVGRALGRYGDRAVLSHHTAARLWGLPLLGAAATDPRVHLTIPRTHSDRYLAGTQAHRRALPAADVVERAGQPVTSLLHTVCDLAPELDLRVAVALTDAALASGHLPAEQLAARADAARGAGSRQLRKVVRLADPLAGSVFESITRVALVEAHLGPVTSQFRLEGNPHPYDLALEWAHLLIECDSRQHHSSPEALDLDLRYGNRVAATRHRLLRLRWEHVWPRPVPAVALVRAAVTAGRGPRVRQRRRRARLRATPGVTEA